MDKQEAVEKINDLWSFVLEDGPFEVDLINKNQVLDIISKIDEPQKVAVPKFVAEWIKGMKQDERPLYSVMSSLMNKINNEWTVWKGANMNFSEIVAQAWLDGYEIEQETLYTVEIPNPNINAHNILRKTREGIVLIAVRDARWKGQESSKLTESEIKKDFDWAFQFAKPVEEEL